MVITLWRGGNRCRAAMAVQTLRRRTASILRYRLVGCDLVPDTALAGLAVGNRRHGRSCGAGCDWRLALFITPAEADIGQPLQERQAILLRMLFLRFAAGLLPPCLPDLGLSRHRQVLEFRHPGRAGGRTL